MNINAPIRFYDTSSLLLAGEKLFQEKQKFVISSITLQELENIKTSSRKDQDIKHDAQKLTRALADHVNEYEVLIHKTTHEHFLEALSVELNNDTKILSDAIYYDQFFRPDETIFVTNDLSLYNLANLYFGEDSVEIYRGFDDSYTGYLEVENVNDEFLADFYQDLDKNHFDLLVGEYLILRDSEGEVKDLRCWDGTTHRYLTTKPFDSMHFGKMVPFGNNDIYQKCAFDALWNNQITMLHGKPGSGKTMLGLACLFNQLEHGRIDKIIIFANPVPTIGAAKLGFYPGTVRDKLLDSQMGGILASKLGSRDEVERLMDEEKLVLIPLADARGYDSGNRAGIFITEAQNMDRTLMKLALQRVGEGSKVVVEGDFETQTDLMEYAGERSGMRNLSRAFRGQDIYGEVMLPIIHRGRIATLADNI